MKKYEPYIAGIFTFALLMDVSYDLWSFEGWQSICLGYLGATVMTQFMKYTQAR